MCLCLGWADILITQGGVGVHGVNKLTPPPYLAFNAIIPRSKNSSLVQKMPILGSSGLKNSLLILLGLKPCTPTEVAGTYQIAAGNFKLFVLPLCSTVEHKQLEITSSSLVTISSCRCMKCKKEEINTSNLTGSRQGMNGGKFSNNNNNNNRMF